MRPLRQHFNPERELKRLREIEKLENRMRVLAFVLIALGLVAMWAFVGYQLNLLEQVH